MLLHELTFSTQFILFIFLVVITFKVPASRTKSRRFAYLFALLLAHSGVLFALHCYQEAYPSSRLLHNFPIDLPFAILLAPAAYLYLSMLLGHLRRKWYLNLLYALLLILPSAAYLGSYALLQLTGHAAMYNRHPLIVHWVVQLLNWQYGITAVVYLLLTCRKLCTLRSADYRLTVEGWQYNVGWLLPFLLLSLACCFAYFAWSHFNDYNDTRIAAALILSNLLVISLFVNWLWQSRLAAKEMPDRSNARVWIERHKADVYSRQLIQGMVSSGIYLQTGCSMADVAGVCQIPVRQLSYLLNNHLNIKFVDFINFYRLRHVVALVGDLTQCPFTLEEISRQCGFGSRSNFHRVVKRYTGRSPKALLQGNNTSRAFSSGAQFDRLRDYLL